MTLRHSLLLLKKRQPPSGLSKKDFSSKLRNPRGTKPWRNQNVESAGRIDVTSSSDVMDESGATLLGNLTTVAPLGLRSPHTAPHAAMDAFRYGLTSALSSSWPFSSSRPSALPQSSSSSLHTSGCGRVDVESMAPARASPGAGIDGADAGYPFSPSRFNPSANNASSSPALPVQGGDDYMTPWGRHRASDVARTSTPYGTYTGSPQSAIPAVPPAASSITADLPKEPLATLPYGKSLELHVERVHRYEGGPVPLSLQHLKRTPREVADAIVLPKHINALFHKIMGWSEDLVEIETDHRQGLDDMDAERPRDMTYASGTHTQLEESEVGESTSSPPALRRKMQTLSESVKYGVLLDAYEKDKFALEHKLEVAGDKMERKFLEWEGVHVLDQDASQDMANALESKAAIVMETPSSFKIPVVNRDCCPGCGALLQDRSEDEFGYVRKGEVERFVLDKQRRLQARHDYAQRMAELQAHWEKNGRQVGEEWLDFMTQEEFDAFYKDRQDPFVCHRCHALENLGVVGRRKVWSAPDFTEKLRALKEKRCVIVLVVDITDFPGSMVYDLPGLISMNNDVIIVANKMDCVRNRSFQYRGKDRAVAACLLSERYVRRWVLDIATQFGLPRHRVREVIPLSAKRGWNVDKLLEAIEDAANLNFVRPHKPLPTYFVGVANVGKSSVINAIAHKLYVPQPPHPQSKKVYYTKIDREGKEVVLWRWYTPPNVNQAEMLDIRARHDKKASKLLTVSSLPGTTVSMNAVKISLYRTRQHSQRQSQSQQSGDSVGTDERREQTYFYDTPGLLPHWHRNSPLTLLQMRRTLIRKFRNPQCYILLPSHTLFLGGMAAIDIVKGPARGLLFMVYASQKTTHGIVSTDRSDAFWEEQVGRSLDPPGSLEQLSLGDGGGSLRLSESKSYLFECYGKHRLRPKADVYVCGLGWASFCVADAADVVLRVRTLPGVVHGVREPLRYNDLRAFRGWPKLKRRFTSKSIEDLEEEIDRDSISTVVRLTAHPVAGAATNTDTDAHVNPSESLSGIAQQTELRDGAGAAHGVPGVVVEPVAKATHPKHQPASSAPLESLLEELQASGKL